MINSQASLAKRLTPVRRIAQDREDDAARRFAETQSKVAQTEAQLREMERYLQEYSGSAAGAHLAPALLANREAFLRQLSEALRWQAKAVAEAKKAASAAREQWLGKRCDTHVLDRLIERSEAAAQRTQERRQQQEMDEFALRRLVSAQPC